MLSVSTNVSRGEQFLEIIKGLTPTPVEIKVKNGWCGPVPDLSKVSTEKKCWLTGFWEGDGYASAAKKSMRPLIGMCQSDPRILFYIQDLLSAGNLYNSPYNSIGRRMHYLCFYGIERCLPLVECFEESIVGESSYSKIFNTFGRSPRLCRPNLPWICGFWDAEGHFGISLESGSAEATLSQKDRLLLEKVREVIGGRITSNGAQLALRKLELLEFSKSYLSFSQCEEKKSQLRYILRRKFSKPLRKNVEEVDVENPKDNGAAEEEVEVDMDRFKRTLERLARQSLVVLKDDPLKIDVAMRLMEIRKLLEEKV